MEISGRRLAVAVSRAALPAEFGRREVTGIVIRSNGTIYEIRVEQQRSGRWRHPDTNQEYVTRRLAELQRNGKNVRRATYAALGITDRSLLLLDGNMRPLSAPVPIDTMHVF